MASVSSSVSRFSSSASFPASRHHRPRPAPSRVAFRRRQTLRVSASCASAVERPVRPHIGSPASLYEVLGIHAGASCQEIKAAYRRLARVLHPDVAAASGDCTAREFMVVHEAYATLSDPQKRADYDMALFTRRRRVGPPFAVSMSAVSHSRANPGFPGASTRRKWETDQCW